MCIICITSIGILHHIKDFVNDKKKNLKKLKVNLKKTLDNVKEILYNGSQKGKGRPRAKQAKVRAGTDEGEWDALRRKLSLRPPAAFPGLK